MIKLTAKKSLPVLKLLATETSLDFSLLNKKLREKQIMLNGTRISENIIVNIGDEIILFAQKKKIDFKIIYEDNNILFVIKPCGIETIDAQSLLCNNHYLSAMHRLDRNTEGIVCFAKNKAAYEKLLKIFSNGEVLKTYIAKVFGKPKFKQQTFSAYLTKNEKASTVMIFANKVRGSEKIETDVKYISSNGEFSTLEVKIKHGKTHQIRSHLAFIGLPIAGDGKYGNSILNKKYKLKYQELYAVKLNFETTGEFSYLNELNLSYKPKENF